jgi:hypothetical protein
MGEQGGLSEGRERESGLRLYWRAARQTGQATDLGLLLLVLGLPLLAFGWGGPGWGRGTAGVCGLVWFFMGFDRGFGHLRILVHLLPLAVIMAQVCLYHWWCN